MTSNGQRSPSLAVDIIDAVNPAVPSWLALHF
jgi:hypothetical protein